MDENNKTIAIVNYGSGNLFSVKHACEISGMQGVITSSPTIIEHSDAVILPGVGAFGSAMEFLKKNGLISVLKAVAFSGKPFMGICLGMQLLLERSHEFGLFDGLGIIKGEVIRFNQDGQGSKSGIKVPHVGWNQLEMKQSWEGSFLESLEQGVYMYFVHSYFAVPADPAIILSNTVYEDNMFCSSFQLKNIFGCQFHPEKSGPKGLEIYKTFAAAIRKINIFSA